MKKLLVCLLSVLMLLAFAACGKDQGDGPVSDTDINLLEYEEEAKVKAVEGELSDLEELVGGVIELPESFEVTRYAIVDDTMAQVEFTYQDLKFVGRYAHGNQSNMSGLTRDFTNTETVDLNGVSAKLRYNVYAEDDLAATGASATMGVADAYDAANDISYMIYVTNGGSKAVLSEAMQSFMDAVEIGAVREAADESGEGYVETGDETPTAE